MPPTDSRAIVFVSSVQKELAAERRALKAFIEGDPLLRRFFQVFLFEDLPATSQRADRVYLNAVERCTIYVGLFGQGYGHEDKSGVSPTEREFDRATSRGKERLVFLKGPDDSGRHPKMQALIGKADGEVVRRRFSSLPELTAGVYASLIDHLTLKGEIRSLPFDAAACPRATLADISPDKVAHFLRRAKERRDYALGVETPPRDVLVHLELLDGDRPSHAAVLLFGREPQRFLLTSQVKCLHFHGTEVSKPVPSYQTYRGTVFELVDQAVDFVMAKVNRTVGTRAEGVQAPVTYELPPDAVTEAIVNAIAHRDYASNASVQVMLFSDRLEVWNPGELPPSLTPESLRHPHASVPRNPFVAEPLFLAGYVEKAGTGTLDMIRLCAAAGLPTPEFRQDLGMFVQTLRRDWLTPQALADLGLNPRQAQALAVAHRERRLTNARYQAITGAARATAKRDLEELVRHGLLVATGAGRGAGYEVATKRPKNGSIGSPVDKGGNGSKMAQMGRAGRTPRKRSPAKR